MSGVLVIDLTDAELAAAANSRAFERPVDWYETDTDRALAKFYRAARTVHASKQEES